MQPFISRSRLETGQHERVKQIRVRYNGIYRPSHILGRDLAVQNPTPDTFKTMGMPYCPQCRLSEMRCVRVS